ncbi:MAG: cytochrome c peroxidase [Woeseiaceae bacterium]
MPWRWLAAAALPVVALTTLAANETFVLSNYCPPGFEQYADNSCQLLTFYDGYDSVHGAGVGGLKAALPEARDGFSPQQIDLGRYLFFDPVLSGNNDTSCASCHHPDLGFADGRPRSIGTLGTETHRAAPSLWNVAFQKRLFWDARAASLEEQMLGPLYAADEMASNPAKVLQAVSDNSAYRQLFAAAFPQGDEPTLEQVYTAITAFQSSLISLNSRYDQYAHGYHDALTEQEKEGMNIFRSFVARCAECHTPPLFTNQQIAVIGAPEPDGRPFDAGAAEASGNPDWRGGFKVPSLRNIANTAPYMHSGSFTTLRDAAEFYTLGRGHALPEEEKQRTIVHWHIWEPDLGDEELERLVDFLGTLTDEAFKPRVPERVPSGLPPIGMLPPALGEQH